MLLSIGMIVKNEEKFLEKCLTSLKPILENVDSELIIADTGSTDNTVEIAKKFTDKVYYFEWINDFAAARNFTMEKSVGEWFMFLDADEVFQSCDDLIRFFNSGEYKLYGNASYTIRSYADEKNLNIFSDSVALRLAKRYPDVNFRNKVHEALAPLHQPIKALNVIADHFGYFYVSDGKVTEQAYAKSKRNLDLLFEIINNPPFDFGVYKEISDCYSIIHDDENTLKYIDMGLNTLDHNNIAITQYFSAKVFFLQKNKRFNDMIEVCDNYFSERNSLHNKPIATDVDMYAFRGDAYFFINEYQKAIEDYLRFFDLYREYINGRLKTLDVLYNIIKSNDGVAKRIYARFLLSCIKLKKYSTALENLKEFPVERFQNDRDYMQSHFRARAEIMMHTSWKSAKNFIIALDDENRKSFFRILRRKLFYTDKTKDLFKVMSEFKNTVPELEDAIGIYLSYFNDDLQFEQIKSFLNNYGALGNTDILFIMMKRSMDISCFLTADGFDPQNCAKEFYDDFPDQTFLLEEYDVDTLSPDAVINAASLYGWAMRIALNKNKSTVQLFELFGKISAKWQSEFPNEEIISEDIRAGIIVHGITEARKNQDYHTCTAEMSKLIKDCPGIAPFVSKYREEIDQEIMLKGEI